MTLNKCYEELLIFIKTVENYIKLKIKIYDFACLQLSNDEITIRIEINSSYGYGEKFNLFYIIAEKHSTDSMQRHRIRFDGTNFYSYDCFDKIKEKFNSISELMLFILIEINENL